MELLTLNADFMANVLFAHVSGASKFCLGASVALHRSTLAQVGGLEALSDYLVEDYEMGRRIWELGKKIASPPVFRGHHRRSQNSRASGGNIRSIGTRIRGPLDPLHFSQRLSSVQSLSLSCMQPFECGTPQGCA